MLLRQKMSSGIWHCADYALAFILVFFSISLFGHEPNENTNHTDLKQTLNVYDSLGRSLAFRKPDSAIYYMNQSIDIATEIEDWLSLQGAYSNLAVVYQVTGQLDTAMFIADKAEQLYEAAGDSIQFGPLKMVKGNILSMRGETDSALVTYQQALDHYIETNQLERAAGAASNVALSYESMGYFNLAAKAIYDAMDYHNQSGSKSDNPRLWNTLGNVHNSQANYRDALDAYRRTYEISLEQDLLEGIGISASNLANIFIKLEMPDSALHFTQIARDYASRINNQQTLIQCDRREADYYHLKGDFAAGREIITRVLDSLEENIRPDFHADLLRSLIELQLDDPDYPLEDIRPTFNKFEELGISKLPITTQRDFHMLAGSFAESAGDFEAALASHKMYRELQDSIWNVEKSNRINELNIQFESLKKDTELEVLRSGQKIAGIQLENQRNLLIGVLSGSFLLLCVGLTGLFLNRQRQRNKALAESIAARDFERNRLSRELHDGVASELFGVQMAIDGGLYADDVQSLNQQLSKIRDDVRHISHDLAMPDIQHTSLPELARYLVNRWQHLGRNVNIDISPAQDGDWEMKSDKALQLYRILQEGLTNALRYTRDNQDITVKLRQTNGTAQLEIKNHFIETLVGETTPGIGLKNLKERAELVGGSAKVEMDSGLAMLLVKIPLN